MSRRRVVTTRRADTDIAAAIDYYANTGAGDAALGFVDALEDATGLLRAHSSIGSPRLEVITGIDGLRGLTLQRYPYVLVDTDDTDAIRIHRVLHTSRDLPAELADL